MTPRTSKSSTVSAERPPTHIEHGEDAAHFYRSNDGAYLLCGQQSSGSPPAIQCALYDSKTNARIDAGTTFAVHADGSAAAVE